MGRSGYITYKEFDSEGDEWMDIGYWNETLDGWVIPPKHQALIEELMEAMARKED